MPKFTVAIAGAGLCGLVFALALEKYAPDVDFEIYEAAAQLSTAGAGIGVPPRTWYILEKLGLDQSLLQLSGNGTKPKMPVLYRKSDQPDGFQFHQGDSSGEHAEGLLENLRSAERIHLRKRVVSYTQPSDGTGKIEIQFQDGTTATCDILVGADGIKSRVRTTLYTHLADVAQAKGDTAQAEELRPCIPAVYSGASVFRGVLKREHVDGTLAHLFDADSSIVMYCGKNKHVVAYPIQQGQGLNVAAIVAQYELANTIYEGPWVHDADRETVKETYTGWEPVITDIVQNMRTWSKWAINVVKKLPTFVDGRVALLADASRSCLDVIGAADL
ncbi:hypothetical protein BD413DRAFT_618043 [Trametes elegans]|nr:hypothetical protein BD413DRAFT_618043 [Trametes elegans]